jgi:hypothetical protein
MARRSISLSGVAAVTIADDDPLDDALQAWAVLRARVLDELTGEPPRVPVHVRSTLPKASARVAAGGLFGLIARPNDVAGALQTPGAMVARLEAPGFLPRDLTPAIDAARRSLVAPAAPGDGVLAVTPPDPLPPAPAQRAQFRAGRGVLLARAAAAAPDQFTRVSAAVPAVAADVPLRDPVVLARPAGHAAAGVPIVLGEQPLHRARALVVRGRVQRVVPGPQPTLAPAPGAGVGIVGYWRSYPAAQNSPPLTVDFCAIEPPLARAHAPGEAVAGVTPVAGAARQLRAVAQPGSRSLLVHPHAGLAAGGGDRLRLGDPLGADVEVVHTAAVDAADPALPATVTLRAPTTTLQHEGAPLADLALQNPVAAGVVAREALPGDAVLFASALGALAGSGWLAVGLGSAQESVHRFRQLPQALPTGNPAPADFQFVHAAAIDADGWFEWPPLARVAQLVVVAVDGAQRVPQFHFALDQGGDNPLSLILS